MPWQPAPIIYPDVELVVTQRLRAALPLTVQYVGRGVPRPRKDVMVTVDRDGGASAQLRDRARLRVRCWDLTDIDVATLARRVVATMAALPDGDPILHVEHTAGPYEIAEDAPHKVRYLGFEVHTRGVPL